MTKATSGSGVPALLTPLSSRSSVKSLVVGFPDSPNTQPEKNRLNCCAVAWSEAPTSRAAAASTVAMPARVDPSRREARADPRRPTSSTRCRTIQPPEAAPEVPTLSVMCLILLVVRFLLRSPSILIVVVSSEPPAVVATHRFVRRRLYPLRGHVRRRQALRDDAVTGKDHGRVP